MTARSKRRFLGLLAAIGLLPAAAGAQEVNLYSSRHYDSDRALYEAFTKETGIRVRLIEGDADQLIERIRSEGANSPADVFITVDAARLARAAGAGILQPFRSEAVEKRIPAALRAKDGPLVRHLAARPRRSCTTRRRAPRRGLARYEDLAGRGRRPGFACARPTTPTTSASPPRSWRPTGRRATEAWARGVAANLARPPQGGDRDQFRAIPAGQCTLALANTYYLAAFGASQKPEDQALFKRIGVIFPNQGQGDRGTHVNISGAGFVRTAPNKESAARFLDYLTGDQAQAMLALGNMEYPAVPDAPLHPALEAMGRFRAEPVDADKTNANAAPALQLLQRAGWR